MHAKKFLSVTTLVTGLLSAPVHSQETAFEKAFNPETGTIHLNKDDPTYGVFFEKADPFQNDRKPGPINIQRMKMGLGWHGIPTFFRLPVALAPEDLIAGEVDVAIMGVPFASGTTGRAGTGMSPQAVRTSEHLAPWGFPYINSELQVYPFKDLTVVDYGDAPIDIMSVERSMGPIRDSVAEIAKTGAIPIMVGGDHSTLYSHVLGMVDALGEKSFTLIHLDAHADNAGYAVGHYVFMANMNKLVVDEGHVAGKDMIQIGMRAHSYDSDGIGWFAENGGKIYPMAAIHRIGFDETVKRVVEKIKDGPGKVYVSIDIDVLDPAVAPAVTGPELDGMSLHQLIRIIRAIAISGDIVGMDFVEYNPMIDDANRSTGLIVSRLIKESIGAIALSKKGITDDPFYIAPAIAEIE